MRVHSSSLHYLRKIEEKYRRGSAVFRERFRVDDGSSKRRRVRFSTTLHSSVPRKLATGASSALAECDVTPVTECIADQILLFMEGEVMARMETPAKQVSSVAQFTALEGNSCPI